MKIMTTSTTMEGSPEELAQFYRSAGATLPLPNIAITASEVVEQSEASPGPHEAAEGDRLFVTVELARLVLTRRPLSKEQRLVLKLLYEAYPERVPASVLQKATHYSPRQLAGLMGAFGRRVASTLGFRKGMNFFDWQWREDGWHYGLAPAAREAMELEGLA